MKTLSLGVVLLLGFVLIGGCELTISTGPTGEDDTSPPDGGTEGGGTAPTDGDTPVADGDSFMEPVAKLLDDSVPIEEAADDLADLFFGILRDERCDSAITQLQAAMADSINSEEDLLQLIERSVALGGHVVNPDEAEERFELQQMARQRGISIAAARSILRKQEVSAQTGDLCAQTETTIVHVNGLNNTYADFLSNLAMLREVIRTAEPPIDGVEIIGIYNVSGTDPEQSFFGGILCPGFGVALGFAGRVGAIPLVGSTVFGVRVSEICRTAGGAFVDLLQAGEQAVTNLTSDLSEWALLGSLRSPISGIFGNVVEIREKIDAAVAGGRTVVIVPHSQGNFFTRDAILGLGSDESGSFASSVGVVETGSPASSMPSPTFRVDMCGDLVADLSLGRNTSCVTPPAASTSFPAAHNFVNSYLQPDGGRPNVLEGITRYLPGGAVELSNPRTLLGEGFIQVTLTWTNTADVDLHVFEPGGTEVYYSNPVGTNGALDVDDTDGIGPENYFICLLRDIDPGDYRVQVVHFSGESPSSGTVRIKASSLVETFSFTVSSESPIQDVAVINLTEDGSFSIN